MKALKNRLLLKRIEMKIEKAVHNNFGYDPSYPWYHELLDKRDELSEIVRSSDPEWWNVYQKFPYKDSYRKLMIFIAQ